MDDAATGAMPEVGDRLVQSALPDTVTRLIEVERAHTGHSSEADGRSEPSLVSSFPQQAMAWSTVSPSANVLSVIDSIFELTL